MKRANNNGFTLVELVIVIAILGVLAAITISAYISFVEKARLRVDETNALNIKNAISIYIYESDDRNVSRLLDIGTGATEVDKVISALQGVIGGKYGPFLEDIDGPPARAEDYNPRARGRNGWKITINSSTLYVSVVPSEEDDLDFVN
jgi:prepilin-type N-terminal cleavage/methylation domain-containing protein